MNTDTSPRTEVPDNHQNTILSAEPYLNHRFPRLRAFTCSCLVKHGGQTTDDLVYSWVFLQPAFEVGTVDDIGLWSVLSAKPGGIDHLHFYGPTHFKYDNMMNGLGSIIPFSPNVASYIRCVNIERSHSAATTSSTLTCVFAVASYFAGFWTESGGSFAQPDVGAEVDPRRHGYTGVTVDCGETPMEAENCVRAVRIPPGICQTGNH